MLVHQKDIQQESHFLASVIEQFFYHTGISLDIGVLSSTTKTTEEISNV